MHTVRYLQVLCLTTLLAAGPLPAGEEEAAARLDSLREEVQALADGIEATRARQDAASEALRHTEQAIVAMTAERDALAARIDSVMSRIDQLDALADEAQRRLPALRVELDDALRTRYRLSRTARASVLLDGEDPSRVQRMMTYYDHLLAAQTRRIESLVGEIDTIVNARNELADRRVELEQARRAHDEKVAALESRRIERNEQLERLRERLARDSALMADKREEQARLRELLDGIERLRREAPGPLPEAPEQRASIAPAGSSDALRDAPPDPSPASIRLDGLTHLKGDLELPASGRVITRYKEPDALSGIPSSGIVIETGAGADVRSVSAGQVVYSGWFRGFGLLLVIDHGNGFMSLYGYNSRLLYPIGAAVAAGTTIAKAGSTGGRARTGVYFEIRRGGDAVDPLEWCRPRPS